MTLNLVRRGLRRFKVLHAFLLVAGLAVAACGAGEAASGPQISDAKASPDATATTPRAPQPAPPSATSPTSPGACDGFIGAVTVDEVTVPPGATCTLVRTRVEGNISVGSGATLVARGVVVDGDIESEGARAVTVTDKSSIGGNLQLEDGGSSTVKGARIDGDLAWESQGGALVAIGNTIGGNLAADENRGRLTISGNHVGGDLQCEENTPAPEVAGNTVGGNAEGQCGRR